MPPDNRLITRLMAEYAHAQKHRKKFSKKKMRILKEWWRRSSQHQELAEQFGDEQWVDKALEKLEQAPKELWAEMSRRLDEMGAPPLEPEEANFKPEVPAQVVRIHPWRFVGWAAAVIVPCCVAVYVFRNNVAARPEAETPAVVINDIPIPEENNVIWTGSDGNKIDVNKIAVGKIVSTIGNRTLRKVDTNALAYDPMSEPDANAWSCLAVGKKQCAYHLQMPDGSAVWLAGGSSLQYPLNNRGTEHPASFSGRGYFDVVKDTARPWVIYLPGDRRIVVKGTIFVAEGSKGQRMRISLLKGRLQVFKGKNGATLNPGEEAVEQPDKLAVNKMQDPAAALTWVNNDLYFHFNNTPFESAIQQVASWYRYTVHNPGGIKGTPITDEVWRPGLPDKVIQAIGQLETNYASLYIKDHEIFVTADRSAPK